MSLFRDVIQPLVGAVVISGGLIYLFATSIERSQTFNAEPELIAPEPVAEPIAAPPPPPVDESWRPPPARPSAIDQTADLNAWQALKRNCEQAAINNAQGEYPALQQMACNRFAQFAASKGWETGALPPVVIQQRQNRSTAQVIHRQETHVEPNECPGLIAEKRHIDNIMRNGYGDPEGTHYRARLHRIDIRLWELKCKLH